MSPSVSVGRSLKDDAIKSFVGMMEHNDPG